MDDPFDHSHCSHPRPRYPIQISSLLAIDLFEYLHHMWKLAVNQDLIHIIQMIEQLNEYLALSVLGEQDAIDEDIRGRKTFDADMNVLRDDKAFNDELRKLYEDLKDDINPNDGDQPGEGGSGEPQEPPSAG